MSRIRFTKVMGTGNDFILLDNRGGRLNSLIKDMSNFAVKFCERKVSVGADGLLVLEESSKADFRMRIFNPDGSEVSMCGNGARCSAYYARKHNWAGDKFRMETGAGILDASVSGNDVKIRMTDPRGIELSKKINVLGQALTVGFADTGVPHAVVFTDDIEDAPVKVMGSALRYHEVFAPEGTNANFVKVTGQDSITVRTYERGVEDETLACGTGSVASAILSCLVKGLKPPVSVLTRSGEILTVFFQMPGGSVKDVFLQGPAVISFEGEVDYV